MRIYLIPVMILCFVVDGLLLAGTAQLTHHRGSVGKILLSAALGALYGGACLLPETAFLVGVFWRLGMLGFMGILVFGLSWEGIKNVALYTLLNMAAGGLATVLHGQRSSFAVTAVACILLVVLLRGRPGSCVPVVLQWEGRKLELQALRDSGNTLKDPMTGEEVLVVGAQVAQRLLGLTRQQLFDPIRTMQARPVPGLRLIPYRAVGGQGFLLAMRLENVRIGNRKRSAVVAFAPTGLDAEQKFQALTGGFV